MELKDEHAKREVDNLRIKLLKHAHIFKQSYVRVLRKERSPVFVYFLPRILPDTNNTDIALVNV